MLAICALVCTASVAAAQPPVGALAVDERQGDQYGWAVDYETAGAAQARALSECGGSCRVVLTFERCAAYAADQAADSRAVGWAESFTSSSSAPQAALSECSSRGGRFEAIARLSPAGGGPRREGADLDHDVRHRAQFPPLVRVDDPGPARSRSPRGSCSRRRRGRCLRRYGGYGEDLDKLPPSDGVVDPTGNLEVQ